MGKDPVTSPRRRSRRCGRPVLTPGSVESSEGHGICPRKPWAQSPTSQLMFPFSPWLWLRVFSKPRFPICTAGVKSVLPTEWGWEFTEVPTARSPRVFRQAGATALRAGLCGSITCQSPASRQLWAAPRSTPLPFSPKLAWGRERGVVPCTGASRAGTGVARPSQPSTLRCPRSRSWAGRSPRDPRGQHPDLARSRQAKTVRSSCLAPCTPVRPDQTPRLLGSRAHTPLERVGECQEKGERWGTGGAQDRRLKLRESLERCVALLA